jgi:NADPH-dependent glutamate synthase beta subunit-like oxidoreductase
LGVPGYQFSHLYQPQRLRDLHAEFWRSVAHGAPDLNARFESLGTGALTPPQESEVLIEVARHLGEFVARLFQITGHTLKLKTSTQSLQPVFRFKRDFLNTRVFKRFTEAPVSAKDFHEIEERVKRVLLHETQMPKLDEELSFAEVVTFLVECEKRIKKEPLLPADYQRVQNLCSHLHSSSIPEKIGLALKSFEDWCVQTYVDPHRRRAVEGWVSYVRPKKLDFEHLVQTETPNPDFPEMKQGNSHHLRFRDGFKLTDPRMGAKQMLREVDYCIYCHQREKDSCSKGFGEKDGSYKKNPLGISLQGCPLDERISEMHFLRKGGDVIAALAMIMLDNPMCPGTGHRICNDCMKGCIFQKQDPVNIPQNETATLTEVLNLPYGFEIYGLLTRFNPLNKARPYTLPYNGKNVMVVGLGPSGYTLCHYLANEGFGVVGIDALKLEPVDSTLTGRGRAYPKPIQNYSELKKELDERVQMGFGGVSEYGITVRWDKNFLNVIYLTLLRRTNLRFFGGVRFGGTLNLDDAWDLGFDHVAIATGAGRPTIIPMKNNLVRGIRKASDFLMSLQLQGAFKKGALANLQVQLPALVIGGGLTAIDTATETLAYYPVQVEKTLDRFEALCRKFGEEAVREMLGEEDREILNTYLEHGRAIREERRLAEKEKRKPNFIKLCRKWGGVSLAYRKALTESPAYRLNHEEVSLALEEGIGFIENVTPLEVVKDRFGACEGLICRRADGTTVRLPARSVLVAAGTSPNTIYEREYPGSFELDARKNFFKKYTAVEGDSGNWHLMEAQPGEKGAFFLSHHHQGRFVSFYGDNHPDYAGNVVKAMASAKHGLPHVAKLFRPAIQQAEKSGVPTDRYDNLVRYLDEALIPRVVRVNRLTPTIVEVVVRGRYAARKFEPGQFYRLQNYETNAHSIEGSKLVMEGLALTGAWVDKENDLLSLIVLEMGTSSRLCSHLKPGEAVIVMGPTGAPSEIPKNETVLLAGGGLGNAVLLSISRALQSSKPPTKWFGRSIAAIRFPCGARRTSVLSATSSRRWKPTRAARCSLPRYFPSIGWIGYSRSVPIG